MSVELIKYDAARKAIEECAMVDEAAQIADHAAALKAYARQADDKEMWAQCEEIRMRAVRRIGQLMEAQKESVGLNKGGRPKKKTGSDADPVLEPFGPPTLAEVGINKHTADEARKLAGPSPKEFEQKVDDKVTSIKSRKAKPTQGRAPVKRISKQGLRTEDVRSAVRGLTKGLQQMTDKFTTGRYMRYFSPYLVDSRAPEPVDLAIIGQLRAEIKRFSKVIASLDARLASKAAVELTVDSAPEQAPETVQ